MPRLRIERVPVQNYNLGVFGFDHLQLVLQQDELDVILRQDSWWVMEGLREATSDGFQLGVEGWNGRTSLSAANEGLLGYALVNAIGTPGSRGSREIMSGPEAFNAWETMASYASDLDAHAFPYVAFGPPGAVTPTINSSSVIATLLYRVGINVADVMPFRLGWSPGTTTLLGSGDNDVMGLGGDFNALLGGDGDDTLSGTDDTARIDRLYGGEGDDKFIWSKGYNIIHGGQPRMDYAEDGEDTISYVGAGVVTIIGNPSAFPHLAPDLIASHETGYDHLFSVEIVEWHIGSDEIIIGPGVELIPEPLRLKMGEENVEGHGDSVSFASSDVGFLLNAGEDNLLFAQAENSANADLGMWIESAEWLIGSAGDDRIYLGTDVRGVDGGEGDDLIDARLATPFSGQSPEGYDIELTGGAGSDTIVSGTGRTLATGGDGADRFVLSATTGFDLNMVEFVIADAQTNDRVFVPHEFFKQSFAGFDGSELLPLLGAFAQLPGQAGFSDLPQNLGPWASSTGVRTDFFAFDWRLQDDVWFGDDYTQGVIEFAGAVLYNRDGADLLIHVFLGDPEIESFFGSDGNMHTRLINIFYPESETIIRVKDFEEGDLGITFHDRGQPGITHISTNYGPYDVYDYPNWDAAVSAMTSNGSLTEPLELRPETPVPDENNGEQDEPQVISGTSIGDIISVATGTAHVDAGEGDDTVTTGSGADRIDGGIGNDQMSGGGGNDTYLADSAEDTITEGTRAGFDLVKAATDYVLPLNVEYLELIGTATHGAGNGLANQLIGNDLANTLTGLAGNDAIYGGLGNDVLIGGGGSDTYGYQIGDGDDIIRDIGEAGDTDTLTFVGVAENNIALHRMANALDDLVIGIDGGGRILVEGLFAGQNGGIDSIAFDNNVVWSRATLEAYANVAPTVTNDAPLAADDRFLTVRAGTALIDAATLTANDHDYEGDAFAISAVSTVTPGVSVSIEPTGAIRLVTPETCEGFVTFTYTVTDTSGGTSNAEVEVAVYPNGAPEADPLAEQQIAEDSAWSYAIPEYSFIDPDGDTLSFTATLADGGALPAWLTFDAVTRTFTGTPPENFNGAVDLVITASDGRLSVERALRLLVTPVNDVPNAGADSGLTTTAGVVLVIAASALLANDSDVDGDTLATTAVQDAVNGTVALDGAGNAVFTPAASYSGPASFTYTVSDGQGGTATATVSLTIQPPPGQTYTLTSSNDTVTGTAGNDTFVVVGDGGVDTLDGEAGYDRILGSANNDKVRVVSGLTNLTSIEEIDGGAGVDDRIVATTGDDVLDFSSFTILGIETIDADAGNDTVTGSSGDDVIKGGAGNDTLAGGTGNDIFLVVGDSGQDVIDGGPGFDTLLGSTSNDQFRFGGPVSSFTNLEVIDAGAGTDDKLLGTSGNDVLDLSQISVLGIEKIDGASGDDQITGSAGADTIIGGAGNDTLAGGEGNDSFSVTGDGGTDTINGGTGTDTLLGSSFNDNFRVTTGLANLTSIEVIDGSAGTDDRVTGTGGNDVLDFSGLSVLGIERIDGGSGNDILHSISGAQTLVGGAGNDTFVFHAGFGDDIISDFNRGTATAPLADMIDLSFAGLSSFTALQGYMSQSLTDTEITIGGETIRIANTSTSQLLADDFILA